MYVWPREGSGQGSLRTKVWAFTLKVKRKKKKKPNVNFYESG